MKEFFKDLKVVELANVLAGPAVGMFFAELGAEVIKIENKNTNGDVTRSWKLKTEDPSINYSAYYASVNWNKKVRLFDLRSEEDKSNVIELIKEVDIVISNYKPGDDKKLGLDYDTIKQIKPDIIYAHLTGFGDSIKRTAYDLILQAETGFMHMNGDRNSSPLKMPVAMIDILAAHQMKEAILVALIRRLKTNEGSHITVSLYDSAVTALANQASNWLMAGHDPQPIGSLHPNIAPYGELFTCSDNKKIVLAIGNDKQFINLCRILNLDNLGTHPDYATNVQRVIHRSELYELLQMKISTFISEQLMNLAIQQDIPIGIIKSVREVFEIPSNGQLILEEKIDDKILSKRVRTVAFNLK
ncbi:MAG: CoA transferase [Bacteroidetes bacterium]|nr:CoA transferase [Bacteroidia bacterium]MBN8696760.1 CoA transferase [Bacteroidota bacterium]